MEEQKDFKSPMSADTSPTDALSSLLSNPEAMAKIRAMAEQISSNQPPPTTENTIPPAPASGLPIDGLASVLSNPELMAKLPQMMAMLAPMLSSLPANTSHPAPKSTDDCRNDLLLALKPFLSPERCQAIDTMLRIAKLGTILGQIK